MEDRFKLQVDFSKKYDFDVHVTYKTRQVIRFNLKCKKQELQVEKRFIDKKPKWKELSGNFDVLTEEGLSNLDKVFYQLDLVMKGPPLPFVHWKNLK